MPVTITIGPGPTANPDPVHINDDEVEFVAFDGHTGFDVHFSPTTPFNGNHFHNHTPGAHKTGKNQPGKKGEHHYTVQLSGGPSADPVIIVDGP